MKFKSRLATASAIALLVGVTGASALTLTVSGGPATGNNLFQPNLDAVFGAGNLGFGILTSATAAAGGETVSFAEWGSESGYTNTFTANNGSSSGSITESTDGVWANNRSSFSLTFSGALATTALKFSGTSPAVTANIGDIGMGVYYDTTGSSNYAFLAYDDGGGSNDDNHDDLIVRVEAVAVNVVPLPAAGWLLVAGLGGLAAMRRKKKAA